MNFERMNKTDQSRFLFKNHLVQEKLHLESYGAYRQKWLDLRSLIDKSFTFLNKQENHYVRAKRSTKTECSTSTCSPKS